MKQISVVSASIFETPTEQGRSQGFLGLRGEIQVIWGFLALLMVSGWFDLIFDERGAPC